MAEVAHVGVQRLGAGDGQHHRAERDERDVAGSTMNATAVVGEIARRIPGCWTTSSSPATASSVNHSAMTGPNSRPTTPVPKRWIADSPVEDRPA